MRALLLSLSLALLLAGCGLRPVEVPLVLNGPPAGEALLAGLWTDAPGVYRFKQSALFERGRLQVPLLGLLELEPDAGRARLVALNELGLKLLDLEVFLDDFQAHYVFAELARYPGFAGAVADSVRRIFLDPRPSPRDTLLTASGGYRLARREGEALARFALAGSPPELLEKQLRGADQDWQVEYRDYRAFAAGRYPAQMILNDRVGDYRLTLWIESVTRRDG